MALPVVIQKKYLPKSLQECGYASFCNAGLYDNYTTYL